MDTAACGSPAWRFAKRALCGEAAQPPRAQRPEGTGRNRPVRNSMQKTALPPGAALPRPQPLIDGRRHRKERWKPICKGTSPGEYRTVCGFGEPASTASPMPKLEKAAACESPTTSGLRRPILCRAKAGETRFAGGKLDSINPTASRSRLPTLRRTKVGEARFAGTAKAEPSRGTGDTAATPAPCRSRRNPLCAGTAKAEPSRGIGDTAATPAPCRSRRIPLRGRGRGTARNFQLRGVGFQLRAAPKPARPASRWDSKS